MTDGIWECEDRYLKFSCQSLELSVRPRERNAAGQPFPVSVAAKDETTITFDANHEMAGKELNFKIELVEVGE